MGPVRAFAASAAGRLGSRLFPDSVGGTPVLRNLTAAYELISRTGLTHTAPAFGIDRVTVGNREVAVSRGAGARHAVRHACFTSRRTSSRRSRGCC